MRYLMINNQGHLLSVRYLTGGRQMSFVIFHDPWVPSLRRRRLRQWLATNRYSSLPPSKNTPKTLVLESELGCEKNQS